MKFKVNRQTLNCTLRGARLSVMGMALTLVFYPAHANPTGMAVVAGAALQSSPNANTLQIVTLPGTILRWQDFSIARGETTRFVQENASSTVLNRVVGANPSSILGTLQSNGKVFLVNPNGIVFGGSSVVDTAGLIASTRDISDANFTAGNYVFGGSGNGDITVQAGASLTTANYAGTGGGQIWLIAKNITQEAGSTITAPSGQVVLAAGNQVEVGTDSFGKMSFTLTTDGTNTLNSLGTIAAERGAVGMFADFVNHKGSISAPSGSVTLHGGAEVNVDFDANINADGGGGKIHFESNNLTVATSGNTHAVGGQVTFKQYEPTQYQGSSTLAPDLQPFLGVVAPGDSYYVYMAYRKSDGNIGVRGVHTVPSPIGGAAVANFEAVLNGRTGALVSGPVDIGSPSVPALVAGIPSFYDLGIWMSTTQRTSDGGSVVTTGGGPFSNRRQYEVRASNGSLSASINGDDWYASVKAMPDGTYISAQIGSIATYRLDGTLVQQKAIDFNVTTDIIPLASGSFITPSNLYNYYQSFTKIVPAYTPGTLVGSAGSASDFAVRAGAANSAPTPTPTPAPAPRPTPAPAPPVAQQTIDDLINAEADRAGVDSMISADADRAGVDSMISADADQAAVDALVTAPPPRSSSNAFSRVPNCAAACEQLANNALARVDSALLSDAIDRLASTEQRQNMTADARAALDSVANKMEAEFVAAALASDDASVRALVDASMASARREAIEAFLQAKAANLRDANMAAEVIKQAGILADNTGGGNINAFDAAAATRALRQYVAANKQEKSAQLAAGSPVAAQLEVFLKDNGELRRLVNGSRLDQMTVDQRVEAIKQWLEKEMRDQQNVDALAPNDPNAVRLPNIVAAMSPEEQIVWANKVARDQARGSNP